ncbi:CPBP family intramembrane glutamic endopeptidase [Psychroserpens sp.]
MNGTTLNIIMMAISISLVLFVAKKKKLSYKNDIGLLIPKWKTLLFWVGLFVLLIVLEEYLLSINNDGEIISWKEKYTTFQILSRSIAIIIIAPITEELIFRGLLYWKIKTTRLNYFGAILIPAILFSAIHFQYSELLTFGIIFIDGLFYGLARHYSKSVILTIILHSLSNFGAVLERIL